MGLIILVVTSAICWFFVFNKSVRQKMPTPWWVKAVAKTKDDQRLITDITLRVTGIGLGLILSLYAIVVFMRTFP
jgi:amino acid transporter